MCFSVNFVFKGLTEEMELRKIVGLKQELFLASNCKTQLALLEADLDKTDWEIWRPIKQELTKDMSTHISTLNLCLYKLFIRLLFSETLCRQEQCFFRCF